MGWPPQTGVEVALETPVWTFFVTLYSKKNGRRNLHVAVCEITSLDQTNGHGFVAIAAQSGSAALSPLRKSLSVFAVGVETKPLMRAVTVLCDGICQSLNPALRLEFIAAWTIGTEPDSAVVPGLKRRFGPEEGSHIVLPLVVVGVPGPPSITTFCGITGGRFNDSLIVASRYCCRTMSYVA